MNPGVSGCQAQGPRSGVSPLVSKAGDSGWPRTASLLVGGAMSCCLAWDKSRLMQTGWWAKLFTKVKKLEGGLQSGLASTSVLMLD